MVTASTTIRDVLRRGKILFRPSVQLLEELDAGSTTGVGSKNGKLVKAERPGAYSHDKSIDAASCLDIVRSIPDEADPGMISKGSFCHHHSLLKNGASLFMLIAETAPLEELIEPRGRELIPSDAGQIPGGNSEQPVALADGRKHFRNCGADFGDDLVGVGSYFAADDVEDQRQTRVELGVGHATTT